MRIHERERVRLAQAGFTLLDTLLGAAFTLIMFTTLYLGFSQGFAVIQLARENLRATQILQEKMETIRLYNWDELNTAGFLPATFTAPFYPAGGSTNAGFTYDGRMICSASPLTEVYRTNMLQVTAEVTWLSGKVNRKRSMTTFVSRNGLHEYVFQEH
jgi:hypothetical protein